MNPRGYLAFCLAATRYANRVFFLPRYPSAPVWHMGLAAWVAGWGMSNLSIPYANNIDTDVFFISLYAKDKIFTYARSVNRTRFLRRFNVILILILQKT